MVVHYVGDSHRDAASAEASFLWLCRISNAKNHLTGSHPLAAGDFMAERHRVDLVLQCRDQYSDDGNYDLLCEIRFGKTDELSFKLNSIMSLAGLCLPVRTKESQFKIWLLRICEESGCQIIYNKYGWR